MKIEIENLEIETELYPNGDGFTIKDNNYKYGGTIYGNKIWTDIHIWNTPDNPITYIYYENPHEMIDIIKSYIDIINRHPDENLPDFIVDQLQNLIDRLLDENNKINNRINKINNTPWKRFLRRLKKQV